MLPATKGRKDYSGRLPKGIMSVRYLKTKVAMGMPPNQNAQNRVHDAKG